MHGIFEGIFSDFVKILKTNSCLFYEPIKAQLGWRDFFFPIAVVCLIKKTNITSRRSPSCVENWEKQQYSTIKTKKQNC